MAHESLTHPESKKVLFDAINHMVEEDMKDHNLGIFDVFYIWTMGKNSWIQEQKEKANAQENSR